MAQWQDTEQEEKNSLFAIAGQIEMKRQINNNQTEIEGTGYSGSDDIINQQPKPTKYHTKILYLTLLALHLYCVIAVSYLLYHHQTNQHCDCSKVVTQTNEINNNETTIYATTITTNTPTVNPTAYPTTAPLSAYHGVNVGDYKVSAQNTSHDYWILCDGSFIDPNNYPKLFDVIGYSFGFKISGTVKLFSLPDASNRVIGVNGNRHKIGDVVGKENMTLSVENIPIHSHYTMHHGACPNAKGYSASRLYLAQSCGLLADSVYAYNLAATSSLPDSVLTSDVGKGQSFDLYQPTIHIGNLFIYAGTQ